jgi:hypothetical protein
MAEGQWVWDAFAELSCRRPVGFGPGAIPMTEIVAWLDLHQVEEMEERTEFVELIGVMDREWLTWADKKRKEKVPDARPSSRD